MSQAYGPHVFDLDLAAEADRVASSLREYLDRTRRRGVVVALSGGIDSSAVAALAVHAVGRERVFGIHMPERESSPETLGISTSLSDALGIESVTEDITDILVAFGAYPFATPHTLSLIHI